jgi:2-amino-4-hydroxy-6-hydroxymethyldihydropteridine diphosphokinase
MSLVIATGSNIGNSLESLALAKSKLCEHFNLLATSSVYQSAAVDYESQPDFFNQVLEFSLPELEAQKVMEILLEIELSMGRTRDIFRGPRTIDLDIIFWGTQLIHTETLVVPHPRWQERSFVVRPLKELPFFKTIEKCFTIPESFKVEAFPI